MKSDLLTTFVAAVKKADLLDDRAVQQLETWAAIPNADPQEIAREIVQRKWLTAFQVKAFWKGRGDDLFFNQYVLMEKLGEGGMGDVFKARHLRMDRNVAIKVIRSDRLAKPDAIRRFRNEIKAAAQLQHENVVVAYDADQVGDLHFFVMEYVEGVNFQVLVKQKGPQPVDRACAYIRQAALGLQHALERGMIHRDIKPANLLVSNRGVVKILDMGLARIDTGAPGAEARMTLDGMTFGTPDFISPEQSKNAKDADIRSDIYSLGATFYFLLAGDVLYPGGTPSEKMIAHHVRPAPRVQRPDIPAGVEAVLAKMLAKDPAQRYQTPAEVAEALAPFVPETPAMFSGILAKAAPGPASGAPANPLGNSADPPIKESKEPDTASRFRFSSLDRPAPKRVKPPAGQKGWLVGVLVGLIFAALAVLGFLLFGMKGVTREPKDLPAKLAGPLGLNFALIPAGKFSMGSPDSEADRHPDEGPVREVELTRPFYMEVTEVTQKVYREVIGENPSKWKSARESGSLPVEMVSWRDAEAFCRKLNQRPEADTGRLAGWTFRLPTEAEWEYACRAEKPTRFAGGDQLLESQGVFGGRPGPGKAGLTQPNAWGLCDMHGNVWEWTLDFYAPQYSATDRVDPKGPASGGEYVVRGGAHDLPMAESRSARRRGVVPTTKDPTIGFRIAMVKE